MDSPLSKQRENENEEAWKKGYVSVCCPNQIFLKCNASKTTLRIEEQNKNETSS
jgi:hypothetical protein